MFDQKIVILVVLGFAIYFLTKPSSHKKTMMHGNNSPSHNVPAAVEDSETESEPEVEAELSNEEKTDIKEQFANHRRHEHFGMPRQRHNDPFESQPDQYPGDFTAKDIVEEEETEREPDVAKPHVNHSKVEAVGTGNAFGRILPDGADPNAMPDVKTTSKFSKDDFLPKHSEKKWFDKVVDLDDSALLKAKPERFIGVDTQGQSLRNASRDLRGEVGLENPKYIVSPWNNSTITADNNRKPMHIQGKN